MLQYRPVNEPPNREWYNPMRDLANVGLYIAENGMERLDKQLETEEYQRFLVKHGITVQMLETAALRLGKTMELINTCDLQTAKDKADFNELALPIRLIILAALGDAFLDATFVCVKDSLFSNDPKPMGLKEFQTKMRQALLRCEDELSTSWFKRQWYRWKKRIEKAIATLKKQLIIQALRSK